MRQGARSCSVGAALALLVQLLAACGSRSPAGEARDTPRESRPATSPAPTPHPAVDRRRGVSWVAGGVIDKSHLEPLRGLGVDWIVQTPFGWQRRHDSPEVKLVTSGRVYWGEQDVGLETTARLARELGIKTLLKPHVWLTRAGGKWRSDVAMASEEDWRRWFDSYRTFLLHYARLAERLGIEGLAVGTELRATVVERPDDWRRLIAEVRQVYGGELTYSANWYEEFEEVGFWDDLDFIGIQAYFPLSEGERPSTETLVGGWQPHLETIRALQARWQKPVLFTEVGYRAMPDAAVEPWRWPSEADRRRRGAYDPETQARAYEAFFEVFWPEPWFAGAFFWKWYPEPAQGSGVGFSPQGKPAAEVIARWYGGAGGRRAAGAGDKKPGASGDSVGDGER